MGRERADGAGAAGPYMGTRAPSKENAAQQAASVRRPRPSRYHRLVVQPRSRGWHWEEWACEFLGTALLVFGGLSAVVLDFMHGSPVADAIPSVSMRLLLTGALFAATGSLIAVSPIGRRSGAHLNPSVTLAFWWQRHARGRDLAGYICAQLAGGVAGATALRLVWRARADSVHFGVTAPRRHLGPWQAAGIEALMTAGLILTIFFFVSSMRTARWTPVATWAVVTVMVWRVAPMTGTSLNTARSLGPAVVAPDFAHFWVYIVGPLGGSVLSYAVWALFVHRQTLTAKMYHDDAHPSVFRTEMPARLAEESAVAAAAVTTGMAAVRSAAPGPR